MAYVYALDTVVPANTDLVRDGALNIREFKSAIIERLETFFQDIDNDPLQVKSGVTFLGNITQNAGTATLVTANVTTLGATTANVTTLNTDGAVTLTRVSAAPLTVNRTTTTGTIVDVKYAGSSVVTISDSAIAASALSMTLTSLTTTGQIQVSANQTGFRALATTVDMQMRSNSSTPRGELGTFSNHGWVWLINGSIVATVSSSGLAYGGGYNLSGIGTLAMGGALSGVTTAALSDTATITSNSNGKHFFETAGTITGTGYPIYGTLAASVAVVAHIGNTGAGDTYANIQVKDGTAGDAYTAWVVNGVTTWSAGIDNSDSDKLKIGANANPSTGSAAITITTGGNVTFLTGTTFDVTGVTVTGLSVSINASNVAAGTYPVGDFLYQGNLTITKTSEQLRVRYDASNYMAMTVDNTGVTFINAVSSGTPILRFQAGGTTVLSIGATSAAMAASTQFQTAASVAARAGFLMPSGTAPSSPTSGEFWYDGTNLKFRDGGTTRTITWV